MPSRVARIGAGLAALLLAAATDAPALTGMWGAGDTLLSLDAQGGRLQAGCTLVRLEPVRPDPDGRFHAAGRAETLSAAPPVSDGEADEALDDRATQPAAIDGQLGSDGIDLALKVEGAPARQLHLNLGERGKPARCL